MTKQYENNNIFNNTIDNPFCTNAALGLFGLLTKIQRDTQKLEKKISKSTYIWIEEIHNDF